MRSQTKSLPPIASPKRGGGPSSPTSLSSTAPNLTARSARSSPNRSPKGSPSSRSPRHASSEEQQPESSGSPKSGSEEGSSPPREGSESPSPRRRPVTPPPPLPHAPPPVVACHKGRVRPPPIDVLFSDRFNQSSLDTLLEYHAWAVRDVDLERVGTHCPQLRAINLEFCTTITDRGLTHLAAACTRLISINLAACDGITDDGLLVMKRTLLKVESIDLSFQPAITDAGIAHICSKPSGWKNLHTLKLKACPRLTDMALQAMINPNRPPHWSALEHLDISECPNIGDRGVIALVSRSRRLLSLDVSACAKVTQMSMMGFAGSTGSRLMQTLTLCRSRIGSTGLGWLAEGCAGLKALDLGGCGGHSTLVDDASLEAIGEALSAIESLSLAKCDKITDAGIVSLFRPVRGHGCATCTSLDLRDIEVLTNDSINAITASCGANLRKMQLSGLGRLTDSAVMMMAQRAPHLTFLDIGESKATGSMGRVPYIGDASIIALAQSCGELKHLCVAGLSRLGPAAVIAIARGLPKLEVLNMSGCTGALNDISLTALSIEPCSKSLTTLKLSHCGGLLTDAGLRSMAHGLKELNTLILTHMGREVTRHGILDVVARCRKLRNLSFASTKGEQIDDAFLEALGTAQAMLISVNVSFCTEITPGGVEEIARRCAALRSFACIGCDEVKRAHLRKIAARWLPLATIAPDKQRLIPVDDLAKAVVRERTYRRKALEGWAAVRIQVTFRGFRGRARSLRVALHNGEERKRKQERARLAATQVTRLCRGHLSRLAAQLLRQISDAACRKFQRAIRGRYGRRRAWAVLTRTSVLADSTARIRIFCARHVQRGYRGHLARSLMKRMRFHRQEVARRENEGAMIIQGQWRKFLARGVFMRMMARRRALARRAKHACLVIQNFYRRVLAMRAVKTMKARYIALLGESATEITKIGRGMLARKSFRVLRRAMIKGARLLQRSFRGHVGRQAFLEVLAVKQAWDAELARCATKLQRGFRNHAHRGAARAIRFAIWKERRMQNAATMLARVWRGRGARRCARMLRNLRAMERRHVSRRSKHMLLRERLLWGGATSIIQARWRTILALRRFRRRLAWRHEVAAVKVQSCLRMQSIRSFTRAMRAFLTFSVLKLQKAWRNYSFSLKLREAVRLRRLERAAQVRIEKERLLQMRQQRVLDMLKKSRLDEAAACVQRWYRKKVAAAEEALRLQRKTEDAMQEAKEELSATARGFGASLKEGLTNLLVHGGKKKEEMTLSAEQQKEDEDRAARLQELSAAKRKQQLEGILSPGARQKRKEAEIDRIKFSIRSKQRETFLVNGLASLHLTIGEEESSAFQSKQSVLQARGESYFHRMKHDLGMYHYRGLQSSNPVRDPLYVYCWSLIKRAKHLVTDVIAVTAFDGLRSEKPEFVLSLKERHIELVEAYGCRLSLNMERHHAKACITDVEMAATEEEEEELKSQGWELLPPGDINSVICGDDYAPNSRVTLWAKRMKVEKTEEQLFFEGGIREEKWYNERLQRMVDYLALDELDVQKLHTLYVEIDTDKGGTIDRDEFFEWIQEPRSAMGNALFDFINSGGREAKDADDGAAASALTDDDIDFSEFVNAVGIFCMLGSEDMLKWVFAFVDEDGSHYIDKGEIPKLIDLLCADGPMRAAVMRMFGTAVVHPDGKMTYAQIEDVCKHFPRLIYPLQRMQDHLIVHTFGRRWWKQKKILFEEVRKQLRAEETAVLKEKAKEAKKEKAKLAASLGVGAL